MNRLSTRMQLVVLGVCLCAAPATAAEEVSSNNKVDQSMGQAHDSTGLEQQPPRAALGMPMEQGTSEEDQDLVSSIRREILQQEEISPQGRAVQIVANGGSIVLRGAVPSEEEKVRIGEIAARFAGGVSKVANLIDVAR